MRKKKDKKEKSAKEKKAAPKKPKKEKRVKEKRAKAPRAKAAKKAPPRAVNTQGASCRFVCSECYSEFMLPGSFSKDALTCPECLHVGKRPDEDFLRTVLIHKSQEKKSLAATLVVGVLSFLAWSLLIWQLSPFRESEVLPANILLATAALLLVVFLGLAYRFESNRWEVYF